MSDNLCTACNLCCDGTLFDYVFVSEAERDRLGGGHDFHEVRGKLAMRQHCVRQGSDGRCGCYTIRPQKCIDFDCSLLKRQEAGEVRFAEAKSIVDEAKALRGATIAQFEAVLPEGFRPPGEGNARRLEQALDVLRELGMEVDENKAGVAQQSYTALKALLDAEFRPAGRQAQD